MEQLTKKWRFMNLMWNVISPDLYTHITTCFHADNNAVNTTLVN